MRFLGVLSGTSADGIDIGLADFTDGIQLLALDTLPFPETLRNALQRLPGRRATLAQLGPLQQQLDAAFSDAVQTFLQHHPDNDITAIGFHGQTLWHDPAHGLSVQLGSPAALAAATGLPVIAGFRQSDLALGGQGAPLAPLFHAEYFGHLPNPIAVVNVGGIANISLIDGESVRGWDCGPGNGLMDEIAQRWFARPYDADGRIAARGRIDPALLATLLQHDYFRQPPPKSTGREQFNLDWLLRLVETEIAPEDLMATACALTAATIAQAVAPFRPKTLVLCGGGAHNPTLNRQIEHFLEQFLGAEKPTLQNLGRPHADALEAELFAWLAQKRWHETPLDYTTITGARRAGLYGTIWRS